jgi:hypothetical protein
MLERDPISGRCERDQVQLQIATKLQIATDEGRDFQKKVLNKRPRTPPRAKKSAAGNDPIICDLSPPLRDQH